MISTFEIKRQSTLSVCPDDIRINRILSLPAYIPLLPDRRAAQNYFIADIDGAAMKSDMASMELPIFTLSTKKNLKIFTRVSPDKKRSLEVTPSALGRATIFDKDILLFIVGQIAEGINLNREDIVGREIRTVRFKMADYLKATGKGTSGVDYARAEISLRKLRGTSIHTNVATGKKIIKKDFGLIEEWTTVERSDVDERSVAVEVIISEWVFNSIKDMAVLSLSKDYFNLRKPFERRLYEIARKFCGSQPSWKIGFNLLKDKISPETRKNGFKLQLLAAVNSFNIPEYIFKYDEAKEQLIVSRMKCPYVHNHYYGIGVGRKMTKKEIRENRAHELRHGNVDGMHSIGIGRKVYYR